MTNKPNSLLTRRALLGAFAGIGAIAAAPVYANAPGFLRGAGVRRVRMISNATGESLNTAYWADGRFISEAFAEINYFMRDWRAERMAEMDIGLIDLIGAMQARLETDQPFNLLSGYRTPETNRMLRRASRGVARQSFHVKAQAVDLRMQGKTTRQIQKAALVSKQGGVGRYPRSGFVHVDTGPVRVW